MWKTYLHWAWKYLMRFCTKSTPFLILISFTLMRYWNKKKQSSVSVSWNKKTCNSWLKGEPHPSPHTSGAERLASLFPSPQQSHLHWSLSWSSRAAWHAPASLSQSYYCTRQEVYHYTTCVSLSQSQFRFYYNVNDFFLCTNVCNDIWFIQLNVRQFE